MCCARSLLLLGGKQGLLVTSCVLLVSGISNAEARQPGKAPNFSVNWTVGDTAIEVINATTGKDELGRPSRLCKHALYCRWMRVHGKVLSLPHWVWAHLPPFHPSWFPPSRLHFNLTVTSKEILFLQTVVSLRVRPWSHKPQSCLRAASESASSLPDRVLAAVPALGKETAYRKEEVGQ